MHPTALPSTCRPRESLLREGSEGASLRQLLTVLIGSGCGSISVERLSESVEQLFLHGNVTIENLLAIPGIGTAKATVISAALELGRRTVQHDHRQPFSSPLDIYHACHDLCALPQENLAVFYVNIRNQVIEREVITVGTVSASLIHPREVFRSAIVHNASSIILAHNHPSGSSEPSQADIRSTRQVAQAGQQVGIALMDHVICTTRGFVSMRDVSPELFS